MVHSKSELSAKFTGGSVWSSQANLESRVRAEGKMRETTTEKARRSSDRRVGAAGLGIIHEFKSKRSTPHWLRLSGSRASPGRHLSSARSPSAINNCAGPMCRKQYFTRFNLPVTATISGPAVNCRLSRPGSPGRTKFRTWCEIIYIMFLDL